MREETEQLMLLYVAGATDDAETASAEQLLASGDPAAQAAYAEAMAVVHAIPQSLPTQSPPKRVRDQLMIRVLASTQMSNATTSDSAASRAVPATGLRLAWPTWITGGIAAALAIASVVLWRANEQVKLELAMQVQEEVQTNHIVGSPHVRFAKLAPANAPDNPTNPCARIMFCPVSSQYQLRVFKLAPPPPGRVYELWLITADGRKIASGTFMPDASGTATHFFKAPKGVDFQVAAVTDEPTGGSKSPTGTIRLSGPLSTY
jgi:hypothetical protein